MTSQEFNHIYYKFTHNPNGIKLKDNIIISGQELKKFVEFSMQKIIQEQNYNSINFLEF